MPRSRTSWTSSRGTNACSRADRAPPVTQSFERLAPYIGRVLGLSDEELAGACRPARESEIDAILALRRSVLTSIWWNDEAFVRWRYFPGPVADGDVPYWVFVKRGEIVAACGLEPVTLVIDGMAKPAVRTLDIMVRPDLDGLGLGAFMNLALFRRFPIALVTGSNERSHSLLTRMFHHTADLRFWKLPLRARAVLDAKVNLGAAGALVALPVDAMLAVQRAISKPAVPSGITIRQMDRFDERVDALSKRYERAGRLIVRRSHPYLNWRFVRNPRCEYRILGAFAGDRLDGYLVTRFNRARPNARGEGDIVDWLTAPDAGSGDALLTALMHSGVEHLRQQGAGIVTCAVASPDPSAAIEAAGFRARPAERLPYFVRASDPAVHERLTIGRDWFITRGDFDVE